ncbi:geranylgeranyl pyrophosphate synthetase [Agyrium rufum]|nr:geranylgeranyl pyrophosphate synthetase [Agyrium rufum]
MASEFQSPNAIPPRTSSTGLNVQQTPTKSVLRPVPESNWISPKRASHSYSASTPSASMSSAHFPPEDQSRRFTNGNAQAKVEPTWDPQKEKIVLGPYDYLFNQPGKDVRRQLITAFDAWLKVPEKSLAIITQVVGMLHTSSLLVDDVEDSSLLRRGTPVAHSLFGVAQTLNSANYVYFLALHELLKLENPKAITIFTEELCNLHRGQGMDLFWRDTLTCPTEDDYLEMVGNKTGGLFRLAVQLMQAESNSGKDCTSLVNLIGLIFQIRDDYMNLSSTDYTHNKGLCEDLTEGKFSYPIIHAIRSDPGNLQLINILKQKTTDDSVKQYAVNYMKSKGSFEYCKKSVDTLIKKALVILDEIDGGTGEGAGIRTIITKMGID